MYPNRTHRSRFRGPALLVAAMVTLSTAACGAPPASKPVMGQSAVSAADMATWFHTKGSGGSASVPVEQLAAMFIEEGNAEGVAGDLAFVQAMVETGWLRFSARMPMHHNNFSGIGAVDGGGSSAAFPHARAGVRAQIQHLRAYADPSVTGQTLSNPLVDPRFDLVNKGSAASWGNFGNGIWATDPGYSSKIHRLHDELVAFAAAP